MPHTVWLILPSILSFSSLLMGTTFIIFRDGMHQVQLKRGPIADCFTWFKRGLYFPWGLKDTYCFAVICHRASSSAMRWDMRETVGTGLDSSLPTFRSGPFKIKFIAFQKKKYCIQVEYISFLFCHDIYTYQKNIFCMFLINAWTCLLVGRLRTCTSWRFGFLLLVVFPNRD